MKSILCPTDFSPVAQNALLYAVDFAKRSGAELILFHTEFIPEPAPGLMNVQKINLPEENIAELRERIGSLIAQLRLREPSVSYTYIVEEGLVAENIAEYANNKNIDLIIMGTTGAQGLEAIFEGSNAVKVIERAKCPVLIIPENTEYSPLKLFVYATDLPSEEEDTISQILFITHLFEAELELIHFKSDDTPELVNAEASMSELVARHLGQNIRYKILDSKDSLESIEEYAKSRADILVMTNRKKKFIEKLFSKNIVNKIAYNAEVPLLVIPKKDY